jgi:hypothetical protein
MRQNITGRRLSYLAFVLLVFPALVHGQAGDTATFEGHVFDAKTLRPLSNVLVVYEETQADGVGRGATMPTDVNGFYTLGIEYVGDWLPTNVVSHSLTATCYTRRGDVQNSILVARPVRTNGVPYRRDFYVTLPRNISKCSSIPTR